MKGIIKFFDSLFGNGHTPQQEAEKPPPATRDMPAPAPPREDRPESEAALGCCDQALATDPQDADAWFVKGERALYSCRADKAIECYDQALAIDPQHTVAWAGRACVLSGLGRHEEALRCYDQMLAIDPQDAFVWFGKGKSEDALKHRNEALNSYRQFLELAPTQVTRYGYNRGIALAEAGRRVRELEAKRK